MTPDKAAPTRVLHVADKLTLGGSSIHGVTRLFSWWLPALDQGHFNVSLCCLRGRDAGGEFLEQHGVDVRYLDRGKFDPRILIDLIRLVRSERVDILHLHGYGASTFGRLCSLLTRTPCIVHEHMTDFNEPVYQRLADRALSPLTTHAIAVSASVKDFMVNDRGFPPEKVSVIYNGAPLQFLKSRSAEDDPQDAISLVDRFNIPPDHRLVATVGRLHPVKGHRFFLEAARRVLDRRKDVTFLVAGDGELMESLQDYSSQLGLGDHVRFTGYWSRVPELLSQVDIHVIASLSEGVPITLFEAMAAGCVTIATRVGGLPEILRDGENGILIPPADAPALSESILSLLDHPDWAARMGAAARMDAQRYEIALTVEKFSQLYDAILDRPDWQSFLQGVNR